MSLKAIRDHGLVQKSVHIHVSPRPANLSESREVLRLLQKFGEVVTFKNLRYERPVDRLPNVSIAIYKDAEAANRLLKASPIRFTLERPIVSDLHTSVGTENDGSQSIHTAHMAEGMDAAEMTKPSTILMQKAKETMSRMQASSNGSDQPQKGNAQNIPRTASSIHTHRSPKTEPREFHLSASPSRFQHADYIKRQPWYGRYKVEGNSMVQTDLAKRVPIIGFSDIIPSPTEVPLRIVRKQAESAGLHRKSLRQLVEEGPNNSPAYSTATRTDSQQDIY